MKEEKVLTKEIAEKRLVEWVAESNFTAIENVAAEILSTYGVDLNLSGLTALSDSAAESLGKHEGRLALRGLTELSDAAAASLSKHQGELKLYVLNELSDTGATHLAKHPNLYIIVDNFSISESAAQILRDAGYE